MNKNSINDEMIAGYLLGDLPEKQAELLDELAVAEAEFFERLGAAENDLVDRYANDEMNENESARFEAHYLGSPMRREKLSMARAFQEFGETASYPEAVSNETADEKTASGIFAGFLSALGISAGARPAFRFAMAAATILLIAVFGGWLVLRNIPGSGQGVEVVSNISVNTIEPTVQPSPRVEIERTPAVEVPRPTPTSQPPATPKPAPVQQPKALIASFILSPPLRGSSTPSLSIPALTDRAVMRMELEADDFKAYTAELKDAASGRVIWRSGRLTTAGTARGRSVSVNIPAKSLRSAVYSITVSGVIADGEPEIIGDYPFRVVR